MRNFGQSQSQQQQQWWQCRKENQNLVHRLIPQIFIIFGIFFYHTNCISICFLLTNKIGLPGYLLNNFDWLSKKMQKTLILVLWLCFFFGLVSLRFMLSGDWAGIKMWVQFFSRTGFRIMVQYQCPKLILIPA